MMHLPLFFCHAKLSGLSGCVATQTRRVLGGCHKRLAKCTMSKTNNTASLLKLLIIGLVLTSFMGISHARPLKTKVILVNGKDTILTVTQYELALVQVMAEMCPPMLNQAQRTQFVEAYHNQLIAFMPNTSNPQEILRQLNTQQEYRSVLRNVRAWTTRFPISENKALCQEFAQSTHAF